MSDALIKNELGLLGEKVYLAIAPLKLEFLMDLSKSKEVNESGIGEFCIESVNIYTGRGFVESHTAENKVIFDLIFHGLSNSWAKENYVELKNNKIEKLIFKFAPVDGEAQAIAGTLSRVITRKYDLHTIKDNEIIRVQKKINEDAYGFYLKLQSEKLKHLSVLSQQIDSAST